MMFSETKLTERVQSGFKKSIKEGKWKEIFLKIGFDHHSLLPTLPSVVVGFNKKSQEAGILHIVVCTVVSTEWNACIVLSFNLE